MLDSRRKRTIDSDPAATPAARRFDPSQPSEEVFVLRPEVVHALENVSLDVPWNLIERFSTLRREHPNDVRIAADEIVTRLRAHGIPVTVEEPDLYLSLPGAAQVDLGQISVKAKPMAMSRPTAGTEAPLAYSPGATSPGIDQLFARPRPSAADADLRGCIVVTEGFGMPGKVAHFEALGAAGLIAVNPGKNAHWGISTTIWGTPDLHDLPRKPTIPVVAVTNDDGIRLVEAARRGEVATIRSDLEEGWFPSPIPMVRIPGTDELEPFVLLHGHYDSWDVGVGDNAVGDATLLEIARLLWAHRASLRRGVWLAWWPGHSTGRYAGSTWFADRYALDLDRHCIAQVNCDSPGCRWATEYLDVAWMSEAEAFAKRIIDEVASKPAVGVRPFRAGDYSFNNIGISSYFMLLSTMDPDDRASRGYYAVGGCGANIAWHTEDDTFEIADREVLLTDIKIYLAAVMETANATVAPFDFRATVEEFSNTLGRYQEAVGAAFSFEPARQALAILRDAIDRFTTYAGTLEQRSAADPEVVGVNAAMRALARHLVPVNFTTRPRFFHDPAESIPALPDLAPALTLADTPTEHRGFVVTHLTRGQNRLVATLERATTTLVSVTP